MRDPIAGYNCFGHVFANRRTAIYWDNAEVDLDTVLAEGGFGEIVDAQLMQVGDIAIYSDDRGPKHAASIVRFDYLHSGVGSRVPIVLSKFGDLSGEYEHSMYLTTGTIFAGVAVNSLSERIGTDTKRQGKNHRPVGVPRSVVL